MAVTEPAGMLAEHVAPPSVEIFSPSAKTPRPLEWPSQTSELLANLGEAAMAPML